MADAPLAIDVEGLTKRFEGKVAVDHFALKVRRGQIYGFLGPNGSGKTTTIRMLCGLLTPDGGSGTCLGFDILRESARINGPVAVLGNLDHLVLWNDENIGARVKSPLTTEDEVALSGFEL